MKEIITVQIGDYANFVGSHFWNIQDEYLGLQQDPQVDPVFWDPGMDFDVLYRAGETQQGITTYLPRLFSIGARGSLGAVKASGSLYGQTSTSETLVSVNTWDESRVSKHKADPIPKNKFLQNLEAEESNSALEYRDEKDSKFEDHIAQSLEDSVQYWTDFCKVHFHPLSLYEIEGLWHGVSQFDDFGSGRGLLTGYSQEEIDDRLRFFAEECDQLQGLQFVVDDSNGFAGISVDVLQATVDEYSKCSLMLYAVRSPASFKRPLYLTVRGALHDAISLSELSCFTQCLIPAGLPTFSEGELSRYLQIDEGKDYHTSAIYGASLSCFTLPFRMQALAAVGPGGRRKRGIGSIDMGSFVQILSGKTGRHISLLDMALPAPPIPGASVEGCYDFTRFQTLSLTMGIKSRADDGVNTLVLQSVLLAESGDSSCVEDVHDFLLRCPKIGPSFGHIAVSLCPLPIPLPFPKIFGPVLGGSGGFLKNSLCGLSKGSVTCAPIGTMLSTSSSGVLPFIQGKLENLMLPLNSKSTRFRALQEWGFQKEEIQELCESLSKIMADYTDNREDLSFDSDDDNSE